MRKHDIRINKASLKPTKKIIKLKASVRKICQYIF